MVGPAGFGVTNENKGLGVPTAPDRGVEITDEFRAIPNPRECSPFPVFDDGERSSITDTPPGRWWLLGLECPPEVADPALDSWLSSHA